MIDSSVEHQPVFLCNAMQKRDCVGIDRLPTAMPRSLSSSRSASASFNECVFDSDTDLSDCRRESPLHGSKSVRCKRKCPQYPARKHFVALDCEMVGVGTNTTRSSVARVVVINWKGQVLFDEYIRQSEPVTDYRTFVSGITEGNLRQARMSIHLCRIKIAKLLQGQILVGHGLENDLRALGIDHPWWMIRDTACYQPFMINRLGTWMPRKLKDLVYDQFTKQIQEPGKPHNPYDDAKWAMNLYKSVRSDWESSVHYMIQRSVIETSIGRLYQDHMSYNKNKIILLESGGHNG